MTIIKKLKKDKVCEKRCGSDGDWKRMKMRLQMGRKGSCVGGVCLTHCVTLRCDFEF